LSFAEIHILVRAGEEEVTMNALKRRIVTLALLLCTAAWPLGAAGQDDLAVAADEFAACDADTAARLRFIEERLEGGRRYARNWWGGWTAFYAVGTAVTSVQAGLENDRGDRANSVVSAVKAAIGTARLLYAPPTAKYGADEMRRIEARTPESCRRRLQIGEGLLGKNARESKSRFSVLRHLSVIGLNVIGAVIVAEGFHDHTDAWTSAALGIGIGEAHVLSHPWWGTSDFEDYKRRFAPLGARVAKLDWGVVASPGGAALQIRF
jgi:hypothetical protein